jgi:hypothetical protein
LWDSIEAKKLRDCVEKKRGYQKMTTRAWVILSINELHWELTQRAASGIFAVWQYKTTLTAFEDVCEPASPRIRAHVWSDRIRVVACRLDATN